MHELLSIPFLQDFSPVHSANQERQGPATVPRGVSTLRLRHFKEPAPGQVQLRDFWSTSSTFQLLWAEAAHSHGKNVELKGWIIEPEGEMEEFGGAYSGETRGD